MPRRILMCYAHPDDESFGTGAVIAKYVAEGTEVYLICATNGDVGTVDASHLAEHDSVASLRLAELECASKVLGFKDVILFGYRDSGMMGSAENSAPGSLWSAPLETVTQQVLDVMQRIQPQVVVTFDPFGGYGHPDHIKIHQATVAAYQQLKAQVGKNSSAPIPQKLYYAAFPRLLIRLGVLLMRLRREDPRRAGVNHDLDFQAVLDAALPTHTRVPVGKYYEIGEHAAACHASQISPRGGFPFARLVNRWLAANAAFTRVDPAPKPGEPIEHDLFAGLA